MTSTYKLIYTDSAVYDLDNILRYLDSYGDPIMLTNFKREIDKKFQIVKSFPKSYDIIFHQHGYDYRKLIVKNYIFIYYLNELKREVVIFRIFHELEDYQNKLGVE